MGGEASDEHVADAVEQPAVGSRMGSALGASRRMARWATSSRAKMTPRKGPDIGRQVAGLAQPGQGVKPADQHDRQDDEPQLGPPPGGRGVASRVTWWSGASDRGRRRGGGRRRRRRAGGGAGLLLGHQAVDVLAGRGQGRLLLAGSQGGQVAGLHVGGRDAGGLGDGRPEPQHPAGPALEDGDAVAAQAHEIRRPGVPGDARRGQAEQEPADRTTNATTRKVTRRRAVAGLGGRAAPSGRLDRRHPSAARPAWPRRGCGRDARPAGVAGVVSRPSGSTTSTTMTVMLSLPPRNLASVTSSSGRFFGVGRAGAAGPRSGRRSAPGTARRCRAGSGRPAWRRAGRDRPGPRDRRRWPG